MRCAPLLRPHSVPATCCSPSFRFPLANSSRSPSHPSSPVLACSLRSVTLYARACLYLGTRRASWRAVACCELGSSCSRCPSSLVDLRTALLSRQGAAAHLKLALRAGLAVDRCSRRRVERRSLSARALSAHSMAPTSAFRLSLPVRVILGLLRLSRSQNRSAQWLAAHAVAFCNAARPRERHAPPQLLVPSAVPCKASMCIVALLRATRAHKRSASCEAAPRSLTTTTSERRSSQLRLLTKDSRCLPLYKCVLLSVGACRAVR